MRIQRKQRKIIIAIAGGLLICGILALYLLPKHVQNKTYRFSYPSQKTHKLVKETRSIAYTPSSRFSLDYDLICEYILGPLNPQLMQTVPENLSVLNVWSIEGKTLVINFNNAFAGYSIQDQENCTLFINGLIETLKSNTAYKKLQLLSDGRPLHVTIAERNLGLPLLIAEVKHK